MRCTRRWERGCCKGHHGMIRRENPLKKHIPVKELRKTGVTTNLSAHRGSNPVTVKQISITGMQTSMMGMASLASVLWRLQNSSDYKNSYRHGVKRKWYKTCWWLKADVAS